MKFKSKELELIILHDEVQETYLEKHRWRTDYESIFEYEDKFYRVIKSYGNTEYQDQDMFDEDENGFVECKEVKKIRKMIEVYIWEVVV